MGDFLLVVYRDHGLSDTVMEIWSFEVFPGRSEGFLILQEGRSFVGRRSSVSPQYYNITLISYTPLRHVRNVACEG